MTKPCAESSVQNRVPIFAVIEPLLKDCQSVLEIGSGTGQHAVYFGKDLPHLTWQTSDVSENHDAIRQWVEESGLDNVKMPITLDTDKSDWPDGLFDAVFSANTVHIMHLHEVEAMFAGIGRILAPTGKFLLYGPFNYAGHYTSESNQRFDQWLKDRDPGSCIKDFETLCELADQAEMKLIEDFEMPANNRILYWMKS